MLFLFIPFSASYDEHLRFLQIWSFSMKAACCKHEIVIQTDPQNCEYVIISGARKKIEEYDAEDAETLALPVDDGEYSE